ncbi:putative ATPase [Tieghemiomyces parasiticus]|uniref:ATPase n=1 Tax=Tieghemiomyces parasiticus TaxID=78921 RepID=A0A9W8AK99_9FUNG|nr:putative ATPase [Tieghemiomyces parasiticus]
MLSPITNATPPADGEAVVTGPKGPSPSDDVAMNTPDTLPPAAAHIADPADVPTPSSLSTASPAPTSTPVTDPSHTAKEEFQRHDQQQRFQRLNYLLQKSTVYANFLTSKLEQQQREQRERAAAAASTTSPSTPSGSKENTDALATPTGKRRGRKRKGEALTPKGGAYKISDVITDAHVLDAATVRAQGAGASETPAAVRPSPSARQPALVTGGTMREYQLAGLEWMVSLYENGLNGILADEMGLGKTLQTISFLAFLRERQVWGPFLVVCPLSTLSNWVNEFQRFTPDIPVLLYHGLPEERSRLRRRRLATEGPTFPVVCTTYELVMNDRKYLARYRWKYIIVDEGHRLKNLNCKLVQELKTYRSANRLLLTGTPLQNRISELWALLNFLLPEIFDDPASFESWFDFSNLDDVSGQSRIVSEEASHSIVSKLHHILKPFLLRRLKSDVEKDLPKKREYVIYAPLTHLQTSYYNAIRRGEIREFIAGRLTAETKEGSADGDKDTYLDDDEATLLGGSPSKADQEPVEAGESDDKDPAATSPAPSPADPDTTAVSDVTVTPAPRRSSRRGTRVSDNLDDDMEFDDHMHRLEAAAALKAEREAENWARINRLATSVNSSDATRAVNRGHLQMKMVQMLKTCNHPYLFDYPLDPTTGEMVVNDHLIFSAGKLMLLDRLLPQLFRRGHRVLIFSQMTRMLDILECYVRDLRGWDCCRIDGNVQQDERRSNIDRFNSDPSIKVFLLSTRAGGLGINLTAADTVILHDSDWNPQMDLQAQDRVHRIGQTKPVIIYRLVTANSVERHVLNRANSKRKLERLVIHKSKFKGGASAAAATAAGSSVPPPLGTAPSASQPMSKMTADELAAVLTADEHEHVMLSPQVTQILQTLEAKAKAEGATGITVRADAGTKKEVPTESSSSSSSPPAKRARSARTAAKPKSKGQTPEFDPATATAQELYDYCLAQILSDADLDRLLDRSEAAYACSTEKDSGNLFAAVEPVADVQNDALATKTECE